jgi:hypothetical protein
LWKADDRGTRVQFIRELSDYFGAIGGVICDPLHSPSRKEKILSRKEKNPVKKSQHVVDGRRLGEPIPSAYSARTFGA